MTRINQRADECGYFAFMEEALTFPPSGKFTAPNASAPGCDVWDDIVTAAIYVNPCFNIYHLTDVSRPIPPSRCGVRRLKPFQPFQNSTPNIIDTLVLSVPLGSAWLPLARRCKLYIDS